MATIFKNARGWIAVFFAASMLAACGGGGSSTADTTPPTVSAFSVKNGAAISASNDASYAVSGNLGTTQEYTVTFSEKLDATSYTVKMLDTNNSPVALPTGMTATIAANDATNLAYTLTITTSGSFAFDAGQTSKAVKLQVTVADASHNAATVNVVETVGDIAPVAGGAFASLADMTVSDNLGNSPISVNAGGVTDSLGRTIIYSATGLPNDSNGVLVINTTSGLINGTYDAMGIQGTSTPFTITVKAQVSGGTPSIQKTFILNIRNDG